MTRIESATGAPTSHTARQVIIRKGDTLCAIAARNHVGLKALQAANPLLDPLRLKIGQAITLPVRAEPINIAPKFFPAGDSADSFVRAYNLTQLIESGGKAFAAYQNSDKGIVSYGCIQFTLQSGNLQDVVERFTAKSNSQAASTLRRFLAWPSNLETLRHDQQFASALKSAANEDTMRDAQLAVTKEKFWSPAEAKAADLGLTSALSKAILFDTNVQGGMHTICARTNKRVAGQLVSEQRYLEVFLDARLKYLKSVAPQTANRLNIFYTELYAGNLELN